MAKWKDGEAVRRVGTKEEEGRKRERRRGEREKEGKRGRVTKKWIGGRLTNRKRKKNIKNGDSGS